MGMDRMAPRGGLLSPFWSELSGMSRTNWPVSGPSTPFFSGLFRSFFWSSAIGIGSMGLYLSSGRVGPMGDDDDGDD